MKIFILRLLPIFALLILFAKISNWIFKFSDYANNIINTLMFTIIGISYLIYGFSLKSKLTKIILFISGIYLIIWNYYPENNLLTFLGILAIIIPILIGKFSKETKKLT